MNGCEISFFENIKSPKNGKKMSLTGFFEDIKNGRWEKEVTRIREINDGDERRKEKSRILPCVTISGVFPERKAVKLYKHSGRLCVDLDSLDNAGLAREKLKADPYTNALFTSASGRGKLAVVVRIDPKKHLEAFWGLEKHYFDNYGYKIDQACKDVSRARFVSYDSDLFINTHSETFKDYIKEPKEKEKSKTEPNNGSDEIKQRVEYVVKQIEERNILIGEIEIEKGHREDKYNGWFGICCALTDEFGEGGRGFFHRVSKVSPKYDPKDCDDQYDKCLKSNSEGFTIATLFHYARQVGLETIIPKTAESIHLIDLECTKHVDRLVSTDIIIGGIGEVFHVPKAWKTTCDDDSCLVCPREVQLDAKSSRILLDFCRMSDSQKIGAMRTITGCKKAKVEIVEHTTITELLALPVAEEKDKKDYRDKIVYYIGSLKSSNLQYKATGDVIAEPKKQKASLIIHRLEQVETDVDKFTLTEGLKDRFKHLQPKEHTIKQYLDHKKSITKEITSTITKIYGDHRERILFLILLVYHSPISLRFNGLDIKGVLDGLVVGDTGEGKSEMFDRFRKAIKLGNFISASTATRTGILYHLDSKVNDKRILRWGAYPLSHRGLLSIDEAQKLPMDQWDEFTTARSNGVLRIYRAIKGEHPCKTRLVVFANPLNNRPMNQFQYGIEVVASFDSFLRPADLRRFDMLGIVNTDDQDINEVMKVETCIKGNIDAELLRESILWAWTRKKENFIYGNQSSAAIRDLSKVLISRYKATEIPLVVNDILEKIARIAFSIATLFHSTDENHENVILKPLHVALAGETLRELYDHPNCRFDQYVKVVRSNSILTGQEYEDIKYKLFTPNSNRENVLATQEICNAYLVSNIYNRQDLQDITGLGKDALGQRIKQLREYRFIITRSRGYAKTARFINFLDRWIREKKEIHPLT